MVSSLQRCPFTELERSQTRGSLFQETSWPGGVSIGQKVLQEDIPSLLTQKDVTETAQCPDFSTACLPCRLWCLREWLHIKEEHSPPLHSSAHSLEREECGFRPHPPLLANRKRLEVCVYRHVCTHIKATRSIMKRP